MLANVMTRILQNKIRACETPGEIEKIHERLVDEFYNGKYLVVVEEEENGKKEKYFFKRYCLGALEKKLRDEGKTDEEIAEKLEDNVGMPVFSGVLRDAEFFEDHESADSTVTFINHNYDLNAMVKPAWYFNPNVGKRIEKWLSEDMDEEEEE